MRARTTMNAILKMLLGIGAVASALSGCLSQPAVWDCDSASDCNDGEKCLPSYGCVRQGACRTEFDCAADEICRTGPCPVGGACERATDGFGACTWVQCKHASSCGAYNCAANLCNTTCRTQSDCAEGYACDGQACVPAQCHDDSPCEGYLCSEGWCNTTCGPERCATGYQCQNQECLLVECSEDDDGACGDYSCDGFRCLKSCSEDDHCKAGYSCSEGSCEPSGRGLPCETAEDCSDSVYPVCDLGGNHTCGKPCEYRRCGEGLGCEACGLDAEYTCGASETCEHKCSGRDCGVYQGTFCGSCETGQVCEDNLCPRACGGSFGSCPAGQYCLNSRCYRN